MENKKIEQIIDTEDITQARKRIESAHSKGKKIIVKGKSIEFNRKILENKKVDTLILSHKDKRDRLKQRDSGLNHVLCKLAKQNNITFIIDFKEILTSHRKERAEIIARVIQNIKLIKKFKNKLKIINKSGKDARDINSLLLTLGSDTKTAQQALQ